MRFFLLYLLFLAGTPTTAGYLTQGPSNKVQMAPPPVEREDPLLRPSL